MGKQKMKAGRNEDDIAKADKIPNYKQAVKLPGRKFRTSNVYATEK